MAKHEKTFVNFEKPYEQNIIGLRGIFIFAIGLVILCAVTFGLMAFLLNVLKQQSDESASRNKNPMQLSKEEQLPPEPRLQAAPGFGVDGPNGRVNLELRAPQSEYWELEKIWNAQMKDGQKDQKTGTVVTLPIEEAKSKLLEENVKAAVNQPGQDIVKETRGIVSYSSAGRMASEIRR
jgi:hypothetical protein